MDRKRRWKGKRWKATKKKLGDKGKWKSKEKECKKGERKWEKAIGGVKVKG